MNYGKMVSLLAMSMGIIYGMYYVMRKNKNNKNNK